MVKGYSKFMSFRTKADAQGTAQRYRSRGGKARVTKSKGKHPYSVWTKK